MSVGIQPSLLFHGVDIVNVHLDTKKSYENNSQINVSIVPKVFYPDLEVDAFQIIMTVTLSCDGVFDLNLVAIGNFELGENLDENLRSVFINSNAPAIMFPYIRSFISTLTSNLGNVTGNLVIPSQFFNGELEELEKKST